MTAKKMPRIPTDRLMKLPRRSYVDVMFDDDAMNDHEQAQARLTAEETRVTTTLPGRLAAARNGFPATVDDLVVMKALAEIRDKDEASLENARGQVREAEAAALAATQRFTFRSLGRARWEDLKGEHPAQADDHKLAREASDNEKAQALWHFDTFAPALIQESCVNPVIDDAYITEIFESDKWNDAEIIMLFNAALEAQTQSRRVGRSK